VPRKRVGPRRARRWAKRHTTYLVQGTRPPQPRDARPYLGAPVYGWADSQWAKTQEHIVDTRVFAGDCWSSAPVMVREWGQPTPELLAALDRAAYDDNGDVRRPTAPPDDWFAVDDGGPSLAEQLRAAMRASTLVQRTRWTRGGWAAVAGGKHWTAVVNDPDYQFIPSREDRQLAAKAVVLAQNVWRVAVSSGDCSCMFL